MKFLRIILLVIIPLLFIMPISKATIHEISISSFAFTPVGPDPTIISHGDTVRWNWTGGFHSTTADGTSPVFWDSGIIGTGSTFDRVFTEADGPGPFPYHCTPHSFSMKDTIYIAPKPPEPTVFVFEINQSQANAGAGTGSSASGFGLFILNEDSTNLSIYVDHDVSSPTGAHIHLGAPGVNGGISFAFASAISPISQSWALGSMDVANLFAGDFYVNIHTVAFSGGEIRGQVGQDPLPFLSTINEAQANAGAGSGSCPSGTMLASLQGDGSSFDFEINHDIPADSILDSHFHLGAPGVSGAIKFGFSPVSPIVDSWALDTTNILNLISGDLYVNLHSDENPAGDIRGQISRENILWSIPITEAQVVGGTGSSAVGFGVLEINDTYDELSIYVEHDVSSATFGHIHLGLPGVDGAIQFGFSSVVSPINETWSLTPANVNNLFSGDLYINLHSTTFTDGEIRGQIDLDPVSFDFPLDEAQADACNGTGSSATGSIEVNLRPGGKEMTLIGNHDVSAILDAHLHLGLPCIDGAIKFGFSSTSSNIKEIWYLSNSDVVSFMRGELYANIHSMSLPAGEIRGQLVPPASCCALAGDFNHDGALNIKDLTDHVKYQFKSGPEPPCFDEMDVNGDADLNIKDLTDRVKFTFKNGPVLVCGATGTK